MICLRCGDCCTRFTIPEINKPAGERCFNLSDDNFCMIYDTRPDMCRKHDYPFMACPIGEKYQTKSPTGRCMNCGAILFNHENFCNDKCSIAYAKSCSVGYSL